ncbi:MAG: exonuclease domain-containing protein [Marinilabiliaceae bacterium]
MDEVPKYSVVDIETTGGKAGIGKITEIAIYLMEGDRIVDQFVSLVNPECRIPPYISRLTGISDDMVSNAPRFYEIARDIVKITEQSIFVAHNVTFDYNFIRKEFESLGYNFVREVMCTIRMSRKILPGHASYSLGNLCKDLDIEVEGRHRAGGDAHATARLLQHLIRQREGWIYPEMDMDLKGIHPNLDMNKIRELPGDTGVYFFYDSEKQPVYIGKSRNIRKRVLSHLADKGKKALRMKEQVTDIDFEPTGSELVALLKESDEIKENRPLFNQAGRRTRFNWGIFGFTDRRGYQRFFIDRINGKEQEPFDAFVSREKAAAALDVWIRKYELCRQLSGLEDIKGPCFNFSVNQCRGACAEKESPGAYNRRVDQMTREMGFSSANFVIFDQGREAGERSFVWVERNRIRGYGWLNMEETITSPEELEDYLAGGADHRDARQIVRSWLRNKAGSGVKIMKY